MHANAALLCEQNQTVSHCFHFHVVSCKCKLTLHMERFPNRGDLFGRIHLEKEPIEKGKI